MIVNVKSKCEISYKFCEHPYLFCEKRDSDLYEWMRELGSYSPIIHLQQSD